MNDSYYEYLKYLRANSENEEFFIENSKLKKQAWLHRSRELVFKLISAVMIISSACMIAIKFFLKDNEFFKKINPTLLSLFFLAVTTFVGILLMRYLQSDSKNDSNKIIKQIYLNELSELKYAIEVLKNKSGQGKETEKNINKIVADAIQTKFSDTFIQQKIESNYKEEIIKNKKINLLISNIESKSNRLDEEILRLRKSANLNLVIGTLSTFIAIFCLAYEVFFSSVVFKSNVDIMSHYIPRISLVIFIEIFAFFFLKLYRSNLFEIKYFNNEKTNIDFKIFSLKTAIHYEDKDMISICVNNFINIERNFLIKKDESTIDLEKHKYDNFSNSDLKDIILGIVKPVK